MPIKFAVDEQKQLVHIKTNTQTTDEEFGKYMSELMAIISEFHNPKLLIEETDYSVEKEEQSINRIKTFNLETIKFLKKLAICSVADLGVFHETLEYCRNKNIPCKNFTDIDQAKEWIREE